MEKEKIYNYSGNLIFDGEYLNGKKRKGKEYKGDLLIFEDEYLNGVKWKGKGKEYIFGEVIFEGEYQNDLKIFLNKKIIIINKILVKIIKNNNILF